MLRHVVSVTTRLPSGLDPPQAFDAQNKRTTVKLTDVRYNVAVPEGAFTYAEPKKRKR